MHWRLSKIKDITRDIMYGVKSLIYWLPIIWQNNWWDYQYLLEIMNHQIKLMERHWVNDTYHEGDDEVKKQMQVVLKSLERLIEDDYFMDDSRYDDKTYMKDCAANRTYDENVVFDIIKNNYGSWWN